MASCLRSIMMTIYYLSIISSFIPTVQSQSTTECVDQLVTCESQIGAIGADSVTCSNFTGYTLVSCGVQNIHSAHWSVLGTSLQSDQCTIYYKNITNSSNIGPETKPRPYARCCNFAECFSDAFDCKLQEDTSRGALLTRCSNLDGFPHLMGVSFRLRSDEPSGFNIPNDDTFEGVTFLSSNGIGTTTFVDDFFKLFNLSTPNPTTTPPPTTTTTSTSLAAGSPTMSPTNPTEPPTTSAQPSFSPTALNDETVGQRDFGQTYSYLQASDGNNFGSLRRFQRMTNNLYFTMDVLCCTERNLSSITTTTTTATPTTAQPSISPTTATANPTEDIFSDGEFTSFVTNTFPRGSSINETFQFTDTDEGIVLNIHWGVSNINRTYIKECSGNDQCPIQSILDTKTPNEEYFFTIKSYISLGATFDSEYGIAYLPEANDSFNRELLVCQDVPSVSSQDESTKTIQRIHVYIGENQKILGMTMWRKNSTRDSNIVFVPYTCHVDMVQNNTDAFVQELIRNDTITNPNNTIDVSNCTDAGADLSGFIGEANGFGLERVQFQFVYSAAAPGSDRCPGKNPTPSPTTGTLPTLPPSPAPSASPTLANAPDTTARPTAADQFLTNRRTLQCYYVMDKQNASCLNTTVNDGTIGSTSITNPSFMTGCVGFSLFDQPTEWYIKDDTCFVGDGRDALQIAAIAICCALVEAPTPTQAPGLSTNDILIIVGIVLASVVVLAIWVGFVVFCVITQRRNREAEEKQQRLDNVRQETIDGEQVLILDQEQKDDRLNLAPFQVNEDEFNEMLQLQQKNSTEDLGLEL